MPISDLSDIKNAARDLVKMFEESLQRKTKDFRTEGTLFAPTFCRRYEPDTGKIRSCVYRVGTNRYDQFETALTEVLADGDLLIKKTTKISEKLESIGGRRETKFRWEFEKPELELFFQIMHVFCRKMQSLRETIN